MFRRVIPRLCLLRPLLLSQRVGTFSSTPSFSSYSDLPPVLRPSTDRQLSPCFTPFSRSFASSSSSNLVIVGSADSFKTLLQKVQDEKLPTIFYFTAAWCGPCRAISPFIEQLSHQYPNVTIYKVDIDQEGLGTVLNDLKICSVPTFHFLKNGEKASEVVGADVEQLRSTMEDLYQE
ncbi:thioredoxin O [Carex littledalei]|uniref:Thioredoxin O n=1 Tax=Carex littledalei TaxID=544730 RepID=A0A833VE95_9POAL|nr:thioredoxin O [Carex littledalei]